MAEAEKDLERTLSGSSSTSGAHTQAAVTGPGADAGERLCSEGPHFEPVRTRPPTTSVRTRAGSVAPSLSRSRSHNGYGCDEETPADGGDEEAPEQPTEAKDPFEVGFDGGDADPMCPRSMSKPRKWLIVFIVSSASFCV